MKILSIHDGHNASACLLSEGIITHAVQEERFTGVKNQHGFPADSISWIFKDANLTMSDIDQVIVASWSKTFAHSRKETLRIYHAAADKRYNLKYSLQKLRSDVLKNIGIYEQLKLKYDKHRFYSVRDYFSAINPKKITAMDHHLCHAASAYYGSPCSGCDALVLTLDGSGDGLCATVSVARDGRLTRISSTPEGNSVGDIYSRTTFLMGFVPLEHEYKLMGMAPYVSEENTEDQSSVFESYLKVDGLTFKKSIPESTQRIGKRLAKDLMYTRFDKIAAGLQRFTEKRLLEWIRNAIAATGIHKLCLSGGSFMNVKVNGLLSYLDEVEGIFVCPSCGDESLPIGAAYLSYCKENEFRTMPQPLHTLYLGPSINRSEVDTRVRSVEGIIVESPQSMPTRVAELLAKGEIVARCSGRAEFGARALGNRSIFADPSKPLSIRTLNQMIKMRDFWMPFAPVLLATRQNRYLVNPKGTSSPYMMFGFDTLPERFEEMVAALQPGDRSARPQILEGGQNPEYEALLAEFERITGRSVLLNTSFNIHGEPMVASVAQALDVFQRSGLRWLWLNHLLVHKV